MSEDIKLTDRDLAITDNLPAEWVAERNESLDAARAVTKCENDAEARKVNASIKQLKTLAKVVNTERMGITRKLDSFKKQLIEREREICKELTDETDRLAKLGSDYATLKAKEEERKRKEEEEELLRKQMEDAAEAALAGEDYTPQDAPAKDAVKTPLVAGVRTHTVVTFEITDPDSVPRPFCSPDEKLIRAYIQRVKDGNPNWDISMLSIPGVKFAKEVRV